MRTFQQTEDGGTEIYPNGILSHAIRCAMTFEPDEAVIKEATPSEETKIFTSDRNKGVRIVASYHDLEDGGKAVWISVAGSRYPKDWVRNFNIIQIPFNLKSMSVKLHLGYQVAAQGIYEHLKEEGYLEDVKEIRMVGHSAGGGIAQILHFLMQLDGQPITETVAFAPPKITTQQGAEKLEKAGFYDNILRVSNEEDIFPSLPTDFAWKDIEQRWAQPGAELRISPQMGVIQPKLTLTDAGRDRRELDSKVFTSPVETVENLVENHCILRMIKLFARDTLAKIKRKGGSSFEDKEFKATAVPHFERIGPPKTEQSFLRTLVDRVMNRQKSTETTMHRPTFPDTTSDDDKEATGINSGSDDSESTDS